jgi:ABC-type spermidine/putrescine transport system permease subunit II
MFSPNLAMSVGNTLILAFFVVCAIGVVAGVYAARALKRAEQSMKKDD